MMRGCSWSGCPGAATKSSNPSGLLRGSTTPSNRSGRRCLGRVFGSCRGLGAETEPFWGPDSCPPQDVVVVLAPSPFGPQDVGELHQSNSTLVNDSSESLLTWDFEWLGALQRERQVERVTQTHALGAALPTENAQNVATVRRSRRSTAPRVNRTAHACGLEEE